MASDRLALARELADEFLFPLALETDRAGVVPKDRLDRLAELGLYGLAGPVEAGGLGVDQTTALDIIEILAGGCLTTTFVWMQHHGAVRAIVETPRRRLRDAWLAPLCAGERRAGVAFSGLRRPEPPMLSARAVSGGWVLDGAAPWVTGWGRIDVVHTAARDPDGAIVWALVEAEAGPTLLVEPLCLAAVAASATVTLSFRKHFVPDDRVTSIQPFAEWAERDAATLRVNGSLALGVAGRCCSLLGSTPLAEELRACRSALDGASPQGMPQLRTWASELAMRAAATVVIAGGGRSILLDQHAQRLAREALFLLVFGQTASIRAAQLERASRRQGEPRPDP